MPKSSVQTVTCGTADFPERLIMSPFEHGKHHFVLRRIDLWRIGMLIVPRAANRDPASVVGAPSGLFTRRERRTVPGIDHAQSPPHVELDASRPSRGSDEMP